MNMNSISQSPPKSALRRGRLLLAALVAFGIAVALLFWRMATLHEQIDGYGFARIFFVVLAFNVVSNVTRWLLTKIRSRTFLTGQFPLFIGLVKLAALITPVVLIVVFLVGLAVGGEFESVSLQALIRSLLYFTIVSLAGNGLLNCVLVVRHFRGTLAATSREIVGRRRWLRR